ncbi:hypothetical protein JP75_02365 [Devosia riboflavina]|uniref:HTH luxR-type domain-containing protein n=1 Tax=Devosia riboflavina TaxID=46914 RepID=A0A087M6B9_9HYPH|nr:helix-turn-helix transcriptional regulator [Devosia riboflavina]KFL32422.1 hypothetical protein JP75_02365 [Devosia riboflavina]
MEFSSIIGDIYDAGSNTGDWKAVGHKLFNYFGADAGTLRLRRPNGLWANVFEVSAEGESTYSNYYSHIDPIRAAISKVEPNGNWATAVAVVSDLVDEEHYRKTEFYADFARSVGQNHMLLGAVGDRDHTIVGFFRDSVEFSDRDKRTLATLLPHLQRAIQLSQRLRKAEMDACVGYAAFESLPGAALVVDADLNVLFANSTAECTLSGRGLPIAIKAASHADNSPRLAINARDKSAQLRALVENAAHGGSGGALRLELDSGDDDHIDQLAVFVSPQPPQFATRQVEFGETAPVLVLVTELSRHSAPRPSLLSDLFGLSIAEGAVALALLGGQTAETVARERDVSLETVRSQIRTVLRKTDATNLRDFERIGALLTTLSH